MRIHHPLGFTIDVPHGWKSEVDPSSDIAAVAIAPPDELGFQKNAILTVGDLEGEWLDPARWQEEAARLLLEQLDDPRLIDVVSDEDSFRHLITYVRDGRVLTLERWGWQWPGPEGMRGVTLSVTTTTIDYAEFRDDADTIRASWQDRTPVQEEVKQ